MPTSYEVFLKGDGGFSRVTTVEANNPEHAYRKLAEEAAKTGVDASGDYMVAPTGNVTYLRGTRRVEPRYEVLELELAAVDPEPASLAAVPDSEPASACVEAEVSA